MMTRVDRRHRQAAIGERAHQRQLIFLFRAAAVKKDDDRPTIGGRCRLEEDPRHALVGL